MADGSDQVMWPAGEVWTGVARRKPKAAKAPPPGVSLAIGAAGGVTLTIAPEVMLALGWAIGSQLALESHVDGETVFLRLFPDSAGAFRLQPPPKPRGDGAPSRGIVRLFKCGGLLSGQRASAGVKHIIRIDTLMLAVPRTSDAAVVASPPVSATVAGLDELSVVEFAIDAVMAVVPHQDRAGKLVRTAAAVALVEFGVDSKVARALLGLDNVLLPEREDMPMPARQAATAALEALREAGE